MSKGTPLRITKDKGIGTVLTVSCMVLILICFAILSLFMWNAFS